MYQLQPSDHQICIYYEVGSGIRHLVYEITAWRGNKVAEADGACEEIAK